jgi:TolB-like protein
MAGDGEVGQSSKAESQPPGASAATSRPVFISYASPDASLAQKVCAALEAAGILCWIAPRDVVPGSLYADGIVGAIDESRILVLILSKEAVASAHVGRELERAASKRHPVVALKVDTAPLTRAFEYFLNQSQWIEVGAGGTDGAITKLVEAVGRHLAPGSAAEATQASSAPTSKAAVSRRVWGIAGAFVVLALVAGYFLVGKAWLHGQGAAAGRASIPGADKSIAVLPFVDMSEKKDQEYFGDGMAEEIIDLLVKIPGLKVVGRTSSFQFKGKTEDLRSIGNQLGVAYVLEGSVRKSGDHLRVTAQLIDSRNGTHLFSQTYDRDLIDVLKMQDEIAAKIARELQVEVSTRDYLGSRPALRSAEAYTLYLHASHVVSERYDQQSWEQAVSDMQRALDLDPSFAEAALGLAGLYESGGLNGYMPPAVAFEQARQSAERALKLNPSLTDAHALLGDIYGTYDWDWAAADREIERALALAPNDPYVLGLAAIHSLTMGRTDEALKQISAAVELNPLDPGGYFSLNLVQLRRGRLAEAEAAIRRALELAPTVVFEQFQLGFTLLARNQPNPALAEMRKETHGGARLAGFAIAYFALKRKAESDAALTQLLKSYGAYIPSGVAAVYSFRGESEEAFKWLNRAYAEKDSLLYRIKYSLEFDNLHGDPRYKAFLTKMNLPDE